jgi:hypothetical protein
LSTKASGVLREIECLSDKAAAGCEIVAWCITKQILPVPEQMGVGYQRHILFVVDIVVEVEVVSESHLDKMSGCVFGLELMWRVFLE